MITITKHFEFEAAHILPNHPGKCKNLHGHTYKLEITVYNVGGVLNDSGMVIDFGDLKAAVHPIVEKMDHTLLNDLSGLENPTAENMVVWILNNVSWPVGIAPYRIRLWETSNSYATWTEE